MTDKQIGWVVRFDMTDGDLDAFQKIAQEITKEIERDEPGTIVYEWLLSADGKNADIQEWFADQEAAITHMQGPAPNVYLPKLLEVSKVIGLDVYGTPGPELAKFFEKLPINTQYRQLAGFTRTSSKAQRFAAAPA